MRIWSAQESNLCATCMQLGIPCSNGGKQGYRCLDRDGLCLECDRKCERWDSVSHHRADLVNKVRETKMLLVQTFLESHSFSQLKEQFGINFRPSADGTKWSLNYDQIDAKPTCALACQCRGLVIRPLKVVESENDVVGPTVIVARPMDRFFNSDDPVAAKIDWSDPSLRIMDKIDGTCTILYFDFVKNGWCVATRAVPEADVIFSDAVSPLSSNTFSELFWCAAERTLAEVCNIERGVDPGCVSIWLSGLDKRVTYVFELTSPLNRVVVKYDDYRITFLAARETESGNYEDVLDCDALQRPVEWKLDSLDHLLDFVNKSDPAKMEGAVIVDGQHNRQKVKSKAWILASRAKDSVTMSKRGALEAVIVGNVDAILPLLDKPVADYVTGLREGLKEYCDRIYKSFIEFKELPDRKSFALSVQASGLWQTPLFVLYSGKYSDTLDWLRSMQKADKLTHSMLDTLLEAIK